MWVTVTCSDKYWRKLAKSYTDLSWILSKDNQIAGQPLYLELKIPWLLQCERKKIHIYFSLPVDVYSITIAEHSSTEKMDYR